MPSRALVDQRRDWKGSVCAICGPPLFLFPRARNSPAESIRLVVNNNRIYKRGGISCAKTATKRRECPQITTNIKRRAMARIADCRGGPRGRPLMPAQRAPTRGAPTHSSHDYETRPDLSNKNPAWFPTRAKLARFVSFNFGNKLISQPRQAHDLRRGCRHGYRAVLGRVFINRVCRARHAQCPLCPQQQERTCREVRVGRVGPGEFHPASHSSGLDTLASSGSRHRTKAAAFR
jgi:hypothetical protein